MKNYSGKLTIRAARKEDLDNIQHLVSACDIDEFGTDEYVINMEEVLNTVPIESNSWVAVTEQNNIVGHAFLEEMGEGRLDTYVFTHPEYKGLGIGTRLVEYVEKRADEYIKIYKENGISYEFNNVIPAENSAAKNILERRGYKFKRIYSLMSIKLYNKPEEACIQDNISIRKCNSEKDIEEIYKVYSETFKDARSFHARSFEEWKKDKLQEDSDLSLWYMAYDNDQLAGFLIGKVEASTMWVELLGVTRAFRKRGIGKTLLELIKNESYNRGIYNVALNVDAESPTNAHKLYRSVGMEPVFQIAMYEKK